MRGKYIKCISSKCDGSGGAAFILGAAGAIFHFYFIFDKHHVSKQNSCRWDAAFMGLFYLPLSHKKDARLIWVKVAE